ncbi:MAG: adenylosuccinate lyase [Chloroflexota bacterium]|nr:MAG: adenylosuccinate lyase [Chloroflexota bacterium]
MPIHMIDSHIYGGAWSSEEMRAIFDDVPRTQGWLEVIAVLAEAQAEVGLIPAEVVPEIKRVCRIELLTMEDLRQGYQETGHSTLGLIRELKKRCHDNAGEWIYYGATVQDITDTWTAMALLKTWDIVFRDLREIEGDLLALAETQRNTLMAGRTHGQPGLPITFGFKVAVWVREIRRHLERLKDVRRRLGVGQLAGGVGSLSSFGDKGFELQEKFFARLGLRPPDIVWNTARDTHVEFINLLAMVAATFDKIGQEVYNLQRPELGEVREGFVEGTVGSITMPHKRNPEIAEHLSTLARLIRHNAGCLAENLVHDHERDGRSWKAEWGLIAPTCAMTGSLLRLSKIMCAHLEVDRGGMLANLAATHGYVLSEGLMLALAKKIGKQTAHDIVYNTAMAAFAARRPLKDAALENEKITAHLAKDEIETLFDYERRVGLCPQFVDRVLTLTRADRARDEAFLPKSLQNGSESSGSAHAPSSG